MINELFEKLKDIRSDVCVTIILNTHRTHPDNKKDPIQLKNLINEAEERLSAYNDKKLSKNIIDKLNRLSETLDHSFHNKESLVIFANDDVLEYTRLPIHVEDRVIIDNTFATRDLIRALHEQVSYYILVLSHQEARLIEAFNDQEITDNVSPFPIVNESPYPEDRHAASMSKGQENLTEEFFNKVDKEVQKVLINNPKPLILATEERNYGHYMNVADNKSSIIGYVTIDRNEVKPHQIIAKVWPTVNEFHKNIARERINELKSAVGTGKFFSDINEIWNAIDQGRGKTLYVQKGHFQPGIVESDGIKLKDHSALHEPDVIDDLIDEMIEKNISKGGETVFVEENDLDKFQGLALVTRY
ncbi:MAG: hypothetical protein NVV82_20495 [Sporocytophaga sp.]|nr:hypothetical protein [Sporocytophaga sp.]